jgi:hypothetical protein
MYKNKIKIKVVCVLCKAMKKCMGMEIKHPASKRDRNKWLASCPSCFTLSTIWSAPDLSGHHSEESICLGHETNRGHLARTQIICWLGYPIPQIYSKMWQKYRMSKNEMEKWTVFYWGWNRPLTSSFYADENVPAFICQDMVM